MIVAALISRSYSPVVLLILGTIGAYLIGVCGVVAGVLIFLQGFRLLRRRSVNAQPHQDVEAIDVSSHGLTLPLKSISVSMGRREASGEGSTDGEVSIGEISQHIGAQYGSRLELVRLSSEPALLRASEMSQQQKIAAALFKAGMSSPALWDTAELRSNGGAQALNTPAPGDTERFSDQPQAVRALGWKCILMIFGGPALALLSLYFLLKIKGLF